MIFPRYSLLILLASIFLAGCSVAPEPLSEDDFEHIAMRDRDLIFDAQEPIEGELTIELAMAMALKYNLENRVRLLEEAVANEQLDMTKLDMLPSLAANAGYLDRNNVNASTSVSVLTGNVSLEPSTSQDQEQFNGGGRITWNLLDFGVSYLQAKQDADRFLIAQKAREKVMLSLLKEVRAAYWKAVAMEQMRGDLDRISAQVDEMLSYWQTIREEQLRAPVAVLMDIRALIETRQQLDEIRRTIDTAQARLANLINAESFNDISMPSSIEFPQLDRVIDDLETMELFALANSADYASEVYKVRIEQVESRKAMVRLLPGIEFSYGANYDDNSFLFNSHWEEFGANLTGDITQLFFAKQIRKFRDTNEQLTVTRKLAINMAVITGVHITWQDYHNSLTQLERARYLQEIDEEISLLTQNARLNQKETGAAAIQTDLRAFRSKISQLQSYADAQEAFGALMVSLGVNPIPFNYQSYSVAELADKVALGYREQMAQFVLGEGQLVSTALSGEASAGWEQSTIPESQAEAEAVSDARFEVAASTDTEIAEPLETQFDGKQVGDTSKNTAMPITVLSALTTPPDVMDYLADFQAEKSDSSKTP